MSRVGGAVFTAVADTAHSGFEGTQKAIRLPLALRGEPLRGGGSSTSSGSGGGL